MGITITKRKLKDKEIDLLIDEIKKFPNPVAGNKKRWKILNCFHIATDKNNLVGVCGVIKVNHWLKLGPFVVFKKYHGRGIGKKIMKNIVKDFGHENLFIGSRNPGVWKIATSLGFKEVPNFWTLPIDIKLCLIGQIFQSINIYYLKELIRKKSTQEGPYRYCINTSGV